MHTSNTKRQVAVPTKCHSQGGASWLSIVLFVLSLFALVLSWYWYTSNQPDEVEAITREGVIMQIQSLNRLQTVGFSVDTVITSEKQGNWYNLWQDEQRGLFIAHGRVLAGIDLNKLTPEQVVIVEPNSNSQADVLVSQVDVDNTIVASTVDNTKPSITITIPQAEIFEIYLDDIDVYDLQTGLFGILKTDPAIFERAQDVGKLQVLQTACEGGVLQMATDNAQKQVEGLFRLTGLRVTVIAQPPSEC